MYISCEFLKSIVSGMGLTTGTLISLHLYSYFCDDLFIQELDEEFEKKEKELDKQYIIQEEISTQTNENEIVNQQETGFLTRLFIMLSEYHYFRI